MFVVLVVFSVTFSWKVMLVIFQVVVMLVMFSVASSGMVMFVMFSGVGLSVMFSGRIVLLSLRRDVRFSVVFS